MDRRQFLNITWVNFFRPLLLIAAVYFAWRMREFFSVDSVSITINYTEALYLLLKLLTAFAVLVLAVIGFSWMVNKIKDTLSPGLRSFFESYGRALFTLLYLSIWSVLFFATNYDKVILSILITYSIFKLWFRKKETDSKNQYS